MLSEIPGGTCFWSNSILGTNFTIFNIGRKPNSYASSHQQTMPRFTFGSRILFARRVQRSRRYFTTSTTLNSVGKQSNFLESFIQGHKPPQSTVDYFSSEQWTRKTLENDAYEIIPFFSRYLNERTGENCFFARTVNTDTTIPHLLALRLKDLKTPDPVPYPKDRPAAVPPLELTTPPAVICLMSLGRDLDAHPSIVHGGFQGVIFDEIMRLLILLHQNNICKPGPRDIHFTVNMTLSYSAPVSTPGIVLVQSWLSRWEGRKWFARANIVNSAGKVLTSAESIWVTAGGVTLP